MPGHYAVGGSAIGRTAAHSGRVLRSPAALADEADRDGHVVAWLSLLAAAAAAGISLWSAWVARRALDVSRDATAGFSPPGSDCMFMH
jgi:hypothetical protein